MPGRRFVLIASLCLLLFATAIAQATSHVRIVRLSYVDGKVQMERAPGQGLERAMLNSPVVESSRLITGSDGLAEVEFEDNTVVRLGEATEIRFSQLLLNDAGDKVNEVEVVRGTIYFDARSAKRDIDRVLAAGSTFLVRHDSQIRFLMNGDQVQVAALSGEVELASSNQPVRLKKNETLTLDSANPNGAMVATGVDSLSLDRWNSERAAYQTAYSYNNNPNGGRQLGAFGYQDLAYYGNFMNVPGYGLAWQPYGATSWAGWDPYMSGVWAFTPGFGYAWSSAYPWGWMPYHYGSWAYQGGMGWFWVPGNSLNGGGVAANWQPSAPVVKGPVGYVPPRPPTPSASGASPLVMVGRIVSSPAYLPDGPVPPNFRSVITDHSGLAGMNSGSSFATGSTGASGAAHNSKALSPARASTVPTGHVFAAPDSSVGTFVGHGAQSGWSEGYWGATSAHSSGTSEHNSGGTTHSSGTSHSTGAANHK
jgi:hypothetical protein